MKLTGKLIVKALRLYGLADDNESPKALRSLVIHSGETVSDATFVFAKKRYGLVFGSDIDEDSIEGLWLDVDSRAHILTNPLDPSTKLAPFFGKYLLLAELPSGKKRLDLLLIDTLDQSLSRSQWQKYIKAGCIRVDGHVVTSPGAEVDETAVIDVTFPEANDAVHDVAILYEDEDVVVINKPSGMLTHAKGGIVDEQTVADTAKRYVSGLDGERAGIVHRLDRDTSGVLIIARNEKSMKHLQQQFAGRSVAKTYIAVVDGTPKLPEAMIDLPIGRNPTKPSTFRVDAKGKSAQTHYKVLASDGTRSLVELKPTTGRTHQLRVHMSYIGTPIRGDVVYGTPAERLMLHAHTLTITLPSGETHTFKASLPELFAQQAKELGCDG